MKKYLKTVIFSIMIVVFILFTVSFIYQVPNWIAGQALMNAEKDNQYVIEAGKEIEKTIEEQIKQDKEEFGEEYPTVGILLNKATTIFRSEGIVLTYLSSVLIGFVSGTIVYIAKKKKN